MKLYNFAASPNAIKVWAVVHHLGLEVESIPVDIGAGTMKTEEYGQLNPNRMMPTLVDEDFVLWESTAIMQYLAHKAGDAQLWPSDPRRQADVSRWMCWQLAHWGQAARIFMFENLVKKIYQIGPPDPKELERGSELFHKHAGVLDAHLADRAWVCGQELTLADFSLAAALGYAPMAGMPWDDYSNLRAWYGRVEALDCWKKAWPAMPGRP